MDKHILIDTILICISCVMFGYMVYAYTKWMHRLTEMKRKIDEVDKRFKNAITPMALFISRIRESGQSFSEEQFRDYLEEQGISYEQWRIEVELLIGRKI